MLLLTLAIPNTREHRARSPLWGEGKSRQIVEGFLLKQEARGRISSFPSELKREFVRVMAARVEEVGVGEGKLQILSFLCLVLLLVLIVIVLWCSVNAWGIEVFVDGIIYNEWWESVSLYVKHVLLSYFFCPALNSLIQISPPFVSNRFLCLYTWYDLTSVFYITEDRRPKQNIVLWYSFEILSERKPNPKK